MRHNSIVVQKIENIWIPLAVKNFASHEFLFGNDRQYDLQII